MKDDICFEHLHWIHDEEVFARRIIVCAANKYILTNGQELVIPCVRHADPVLRNQVMLLIEAGLLAKPQCAPHNQGFIDQYNNWWSREDAYIIAKAGEQINDDRNGHDSDLFSEGLY